MYTISRNIDRPQVLPLIAIALCAKIKSLWKSRQNIA